MSYSTLSSLNNRPETAQLLGNMTAAWSHAERVIYLTFWVASGASQSKAFEIYERMPSFKARYDLTLSLLQQEVGSHPGFTGLVCRMKRLLACFQERNEFTHRTWVKDDDGNLFLLDHRMPQKQAQIMPVSDQKIMNLNNKIIQTCDEMIGMFREIFPDDFEGVRP